MAMPEVCEVEAVAAVGWAPYPLESESPVRREDFPQTKRGEELFRIAVDTEWRVRTGARLDPEAGLEKPAGELATACLEVPCPACGALLGEPCNRAAGWLYLGYAAPGPGQVHFGRTVHAEALLWERQAREQMAEAALGVPCPHAGCAAARGVPCSGEQAHDGRLAVAFAVEGEQQSAREFERMALAGAPKVACPVCTSSGLCRTRGGKHCSTHPEKDAAEDAARAWIAGPVEAALKAWLEAGVAAGRLACRECQNEGAPWCQCATVPFPDDAPDTWSWHCEACGSAQPHRTGGEWCGFRAGERRLNGTFALVADVPGKQKRAKKAEEPWTKWKASHAGECAVGPGTGVWDDCVRCVAEERQRHRENESRVGAVQEPALDEACRVPCPECYARAGAACLVSKDGVRVTCRQRVSLAGRTPVGFEAAVGAGVAARQLGLF